MALATMGKVIIVARNSQPVNTVMRSLKPTSTGPLRIAIEKPLKPLRMNMNALKRMGEKRTKIIIIA